MGSFLQDVRYAGRSLRKRPSAGYFRKDGDKITNVRVGGHAVQIMEGTLTL